MPTLDKIPWYERYAGFLIPTEFSNLILYCGFAALGFMIGAIFGFVLVYVADEPPTLMIKIALTGAFIGLVSGVVFIGMTEGTVSALWGHGRKVDEKAMAFGELMDLAVASQRNHQYAEAVNRLREIVERDLTPRPEAIWYRVGLVEHELRRDYKRAAYAYRKAIALLEQKLESKQEFSREATLMRECTTRLKSLSPRLDEVDKGVHLRRDAIMDLVADEKFEEAAEATRRLMQDNPDDAENNFLRGYVLAQTGQRQLAVETYRVAVEIDGHHVRALYNLAAVLDVIEDVDGAVPAYEQYLAVAADDADESEWVEQAKMQLARLKEEVGRRTVHLQGR